MEEEEYDEIEEEDEVEEVIEKKVKTTFENEFGKDMEKNIEENIVDEYKALRPVEKYPNLDLLLLNELIRKTQIHKNYVSSLSYMRAELPQKPIVKGEQYKFREALQQEAYEFAKGYEVGRKYSFIPYEQYYCYTEGVLFKTIPVKRLVLKNEIPYLNIFSSRFSNRSVNVYLNRFYGFYLASKEAEIYGLDCLFYTEPHLDDVLMKNFLESPYRFGEYRIAIQVNWYLVQAVFRINKQVYFDMVYFLERWGDGDQWFVDTIEKAYFGREEDEGYIEEDKPFQLRYFEQLEDLRMRLGNHILGYPQSGEVILLRDDKIYHPKNREIVLEELRKIEGYYGNRFASLSDPELPFPFYSADWNVEMLVASKGSKVYYHDVTHIEDLVIHEMYLKVLFTPRKVIHTHTLLSVEQIQQLDPKYSYVIVCCRYEVFDHFLGIAEKLLDFKILFWLTPDPTNAFLEKRFGYNIYFYSCDKKRADKMNALLYKNMLLIREMNNDKTLKSMRWEIRYEILEYHVEPPKPKPALTNVVVDLYDVELYQKTKKESQKLYGYSTKYDYEWLYSVSNRFTDRYSMIEKELTRGYEPYRGENRPLLGVVRKNKCGELVTLDYCSFHHRVGLAAYEKDNIQPQDVLDIAQSQTDGSFTVNLYLGYVVYPEDFETLNAILKAFAHTKELNKDLRLIVVLNIFDNKTDEEIHIYYYNRRGDSYYKTMDHNILQTLQSLSLIRGYHLYLVVEDQEFLKDVKIREQIRHIRYFNPITYNYVCGNLYSENHLGPDYVYLDVDYQKRGERAIERLVEYGFDIILLDPKRKFLRNQMKTMLSLLPHYKSFDWVKTIIVYGVGGPDDIYTLIITNKFYRVYSDLESAECARSKIAGCYEILCCTYHLYWYVKDYEDKLETILDPETPLNVSVYRNKEQVLVLVYTKQKEKSMYQKKNFMSNHYR